MRLFVQNAALTARRDFRTSTVPPMRRDSSYIQCVYWRISLCYRTLLRRTCSRESSQGLETTLEGSSGGPSIHFFSTYGGHERRLDPFLFASSLFLFHTYHLKDALKDAAPGLGLSAYDIEAAITNDPRLALLADLANLDKHVNLNRLRSGSAPVIEQVCGVDSSTGSGWSLSVKIKHGATVLDGMTVAQNAAAGWREKLTAWGIM